MARRTTGAAPEVRLRTEKRLWGPLSRLSFDIARKYSRVVGRVPLAEWDGLLGAAGCRRETVWETGTRIAELIEPPDEPLPRPGIWSSELDLRTATALDIRRGGRQRESPMASRSGATYGALGNDAGPCRGRSAT